MTPEHNQIAQLTAERDEFKSEVSILEKQRDALIRECGAFARSAGLAESQRDALRANLKAGVSLARTVLHLVEPGDSDQATALRALRGWVEQNLR